MISVIERPSQILCYMTSWSQKRSGIGKFTPENIDASLCTHVIYAFGALKDHKLTISDDKDDKEDENYAKVTALKEKNPTLKVNIILVYKLYVEVAHSHFSNLNFSLSLMEITVNRYF